ncbi:MAG: hypothetical protein M3Z96_01620 [Pseudomonadota bacterium]|nr:hypothetical protein [Pseudomonadota bacterium]
MRKLLDELHLQQAGQTGTRQSSAEELVDVSDGALVLHFTYRYLEAHSVPPSDDEVHNVTAAIARYKGPRFVSWATLESFLEGLHVIRRA